MAAKLAEKDRTLDEAKNIIAREVQEEKEKSQLAERERFAILLVIKIILSIYIYYYMVKVIKR